MKDAQERAQDLVGRLYFHGVKNAEDVKRAVEFSKEEMQLYGMDMAFIGFCVGVVLTGVFVLLCLP